MVPVIPTDATPGFFSFSFFLFPSCGSLILKVLHCAFQLRLWIKSCKDWVQLQNCWRVFYPRIRWSWEKKKTKGKSQSQQLSWRLWDCGSSCPSGLQKCTRQSCPHRKTNASQTKTNRVGCWEWMGQHCVLVSSLPSASMLS